MCAATAAGASTGLHSLIGTVIADEVEPSSHLGPTETRSQEWDGFAVPRLFLERRSVTIAEELIATLPQEQFDRFRSSIGRDQLCSNGSRKSMS